MARKERLKGVRGKVLSTKAAAKLLDCHPSTVGALVRQQKLFAYQYGRGYVIPEACLQQYVNNPGGSTEPPLSPRELKFVEALENMVEKYLPYP
jgi:excisionase family DNA binding protein